MTAAVRAEVLPRLHKMISFMKPKISLFSFYQVPYLVTILPSVYKGLEITTKKGSISEPLPHGCNLPRELGIVTGKSKSHSRPSFGEGSQNPPIRIERRQMGSGRFL